MSCLKVLIRTVAKSGPALLLIAAIVSPTASQATPASQERAGISREEIPAEFAPAVQFLELIKYPAEPKLGFDPKDAPVWKRDALLSHISAKGVLFTARHDATKVKYSLKQIEAAIKTRRGDAYRSLAHLAYIYSQPYQQYSELQFSKEGSRQIITLSFGYKLTFEFEGGKPKLVRCDDLVYDED